MAEEKKISQLANTANLASTDKLLVLRNPTSNASVRLVEFSTLSANLQISNSVPANSSSNGLAGTIRLDGNYLYACVANNSWKRVQLTTF